MKTPNQFLTIVCICIPLFVWAQPDNLPLDGATGKCYAQCYIQDQYEVITEQVMIKDESVSVDVVTPELEIIKQKIQLEAKAVRKIPTAPIYETITEEILIEPERKEYNIIPAKYETYTDRIEIKPQSTRLVMVQPNGTNNVNAKGVALVSSALPYLVNAASYAIERIPMEYETETEEIQVKPATKKWIQYAVDKSCLHQDPDECKLWGLVESPEEIQTIIRRIPKGCPTGYLQSRDSKSGKEDCIRITKIDPVYNTPTVAEPTFKEEIIPAEYLTVTKKRLVSPATVEETIIPAKYKTITKQVLKKPAGFEEEEVPATYGTVDISIRKGLTLTQGYEFSPEGILTSSNRDAAPKDMDTPALYTNWEEAGCPTGYLFDGKDNACKRILVVPAEYRTITKRLLKEQGGFTDFREVLCPRKVTNEVSKIQRALLDKGYNPGPIDNIMGPKTRAALVQFQEDNSLPFGNLNLETLSALGIQ